MRAKLRITLYSFMAVLTIAVQATHNHSTPSQTLAPSSPTPSLAHGWSVWRMDYRRA